MSLSMHMSAHLTEKRPGNTGGTVLGEEVRWHLD